MKQVLFTFIFFFSLSVHSQVNSFGGTFYYGEAVEKPSGIIHIYPTSDSTYLFYLEVGRGAPSYNSGAIIGEMELWSENTTRFQQMDEFNGVHCGLYFKLSNDCLIITTSEHMEECGYGYGVFSDGTYIRQSYDIQEFYIDREGNKTFFKDFK